MKPLPKRLVIDTATHARYVGLFEGNKALYEVYESGHNNHSETLIPSIEKALHATSIQLGDLDGIIVGIGPGSYTGVRIGVTVAKMFGWTLSLPVFTVSSLALMASAHESDQPIIPTIDARRGNAFLGVYHYENSMLTRFEEDQHTALEPFLKTHQGMRCVHEGKPNPRVLFDSPLVQLIDNIHTLAPHYLRKTEAERNLES